MKPDGAPTAGNLVGRRIVVPESRALDLFAGMLEREGATTIRCPLVAIRDVEDPAPVDAWLQRLVAGEHDHLVLFTGEGVTRLLDFARRSGIEAEVLEGLRHVRKLARGPKPSSALRKAGLSPDLVVDPPTTEGLIATLATLDLAGRRVGVQLYPESPNTLVDFLAGAGARPDPVLCYRYASDEEDLRVGDVLRAMAAGEVDLIAFTSTPQVRRLQDVARKLQQDSVLQDAMRRTRIAAIGPVTAEAVARAGWTAAITPASSFHLKPFVRAIGVLYSESANGRKPQGAGEDWR